MADSMDVHVRAILSAGGGIAKQMAGLGRSMTAVSDGIIASTARSTAALGKMAAVATVAVGGLLGRNAIGGGLAFNALIEEIRLGVASTLTLYEYLPAGIKESATEAEKFNARINEGRKISAQLVRIAAQSPGEIKDVERMFMSLLPAAQTFGGSIEDTLKLTQQTAIMAALMENRFDLAGRQMSALLTGGATKAQKTFRLLTGPILEAARKMPEISKKFQGVSAGSREFTKVWNSGLSSVERANLLLKAMDKLGGEAAKAYSQSWEGASAAVKSAWDYLRGSMAEPMFEGLKKEFIRVTGEGGVLQFGGAKYEKLRALMTSLGTLIAKPIIGVVRGVFNFAEYVADHWEVVFDKVTRAFDMGFKVAKLFLVAKAVGTVAKAPLLIFRDVVRGMNLLSSAGEIVGSTLSSLIKTLGMSMGSLASMFTVGVAAAAAMAAVVAFGGALVVAAGVTAYFLDNWDSVVKSIRDGTVSLGPLWEALDLMWARLVDLGAAFLGTSSATDGMNSAVLFAADVVHMISGAMGGLLDAGVGVVKMFNYMQMVMKTVAYAVTSILGTMFDVVSKVTSIAIDDKYNPFVKGRDALKSARDSLGKTSLLDFSEDVANISRAEDIAKAYHEAIPKANSAIAKLKEKFEASMKAGKSRSKPGEKGPKIDIHNLHVYNDLRNEDPDRIMNVFWKGVEEKALRPLSSPSLLEHGI